MASDREHRRPGARKAGPKSDAPTVVGGEESTAAASATHVEAPIPASKPAAAGQGLVTSVDESRNGKLRTEVAAVSEKLPAGEPDTLVIADTPFRSRLIVGTGKYTSNEVMVKAIGETLRPETLVCIAVNLTLPDETIERRTAAAWKREDPVRFAKRPALFVLDAGSV